MSITFSDALTDSTISHSSSSPVNDDSSSLSRTSSPQMALFKPPMNYSSQYKINYICSCLNRLNIQNRNDLVQNIHELMAQILQNPRIFNVNSSNESNFLIFREAISSYNKVHSAMINIEDYDIYDFLELLQETESDDSEFDDSGDDLASITSSYDVLSESRQSIRKTSQLLMNLLDGRDHVECPAIILGTGDTGTTIWLEKYRGHHRTTEDLLDLGFFPDVLMIGEDFGCWWHDYTLAQRHNLLERSGVPANPSDYVPTHAYVKNPHANARHIHQANLVNLAATEAPMLLGAKVLRIERQANHTSDWQRLGCGYRMIILTQDGEKAIYTQSIDVCTGLGPAKNPLVGDIVSQGDFDKLSKFDPVKKCTPIIDGNAFVLSNTEESSSIPRTIVVYGGGGTGAACFRKAFHGTDIDTADLPFNPALSKNKVAWHAMNGFETAGKGKLATAAITGAQQLDSLHVNKLVKVTYNEMSGKLRLVFEIPQSSGTSSVSYSVVECDQLVYSVGQENQELRSICSEFEDELELHYDVTDMPTCVRSSDQNIHFFGAAAMAIRPKEFVPGTWKWLHSENIGPDVGPGSMPPSRSQIKRYLTRSGSPLVSVNANVDSHSLIREFLNNAGVDSSKISHIVSDILEARKESTSGCSYQTLSDLIAKHKIADCVQISGHGHLIYADNLSYDSDVESSVD